MRKRWRQLRFWWLSSNRGWRRLPGKVRAAVWFGWVIATVFTLYVAWLNADSFSVPGFLFVWLVGIVGSPVVVLSNCWYARRGGWWP